LFEIWIGLFLVGDPLIEVGILGEFSFTQIDLMVYLINFGFLLNGLHFFASQLFLDFGVIGDRWFFVDLNRIGRLDHFNNLIFLFFLFFLYFKVFISRLLLACVYEQASQLISFLLMNFLFNDLGFLRLLVLSKGVHDVSQHKLHSEERAKDYHKAEIANGNHRVVAVHVVVHQRCPSLQSQTLENCEQT